MEKNLLNRINKLKQDLNQVSVPSLEKPDTLDPYLSQSYKNPLADLPSISSHQHFKKLLLEKTTRITELEEELAYIREKSKTKEQDLITKYESAIESIKKNYEGLLKYNELELVKYKQYSGQNDFADLIENLKLLEQENTRLKNEMKNLQVAFKKEKSLLEQEMIDFRESFINNSDKQEVERLVKIKEKLQKEISIYQKSKDEEAEDYEEKYSKAVRIAEMWKFRSDQLAYKFFTYLRNLKIEVFEIKNEILTNFEEALTCASSMVSRLFKKYKFVRGD